MANFIDQDQQWLLNCLSATLDPNHEVRSFAEASLHQASLQPGFIPSLPTFSLFLYAYIFSSILHYAFDSSENAVASDVVLSVNIFQVDSIFLGIGYDFHCNSQIIVRPCFLLLI